MKKFTSLRLLVLAMKETPVNVELIGKGLNKRIALWIKRGEVTEKDGMLSLT